MLFLVAVGVALGLGYATGQAFTASNTVPVTAISQFTQAITPANLEPSECASSFTVTSIVAGSGNVTPTAPFQLVLGSSSRDTLDDTSNNEGNDCMVGGSNKDSFTGWKHHNDLCIVSNATQSAGNVTDCTVVATRP